MKKNTNHKKMYKKIISKDTWTYPDWILNVVCEIVDDFRNGICQLAGVAILVCVTRRRKGNIGKEYYANLKQYKNTMPTLNKIVS